MDASRLPVIASSLFLKISKSSLISCFLLIFHVLAFHPLTHAQFSAEKPQPPSNPNPVSVKKPKISAALISEPYASERELLENFPKLDLVAQRDITYLYAKLHKTKLATYLGEEILKKHPRDRDTLIVLVAMYQEKLDGPKIEKYARKLLDLKADDPEGLYYLGYAKIVQGQYEEAKQIYMEMESKYTNPADFPHKADLARAAHRAGDWQNAIRVYRNMLLDTSVQGELRNDTRLALDELYLIHLPHLRARVEYTGLTQGKILREHVTYRQHITEDHRLIVDIKRDDLWQDGDVSVQTKDDGRTQALVGVEIRHNPQLFSTFQIGGGESATGNGENRSRFIANAELRHVLEPERFKFVYLRADYNDRATDSLNLELLDGRQNKVALGTIYQVDINTIARAELNLRQLTIGDGFNEELYGETFGLNWGIDHTLFYRPVQLIVSYAGEYMTLGRNTHDLSLVDPIIKDNASAIERRAVLEGLVDTEINRHEFITTVIGDITNQWSYEFSSSVGYSVPAEENPLYGFRLATTYFFTKSISLRIEGGYLSSGSSSNAGSESQDVVLTLNAYF